MWADVDSAWEQEKPEVWKMLENAGESHTSGAPNQDSGPSFFPKETVKRYFHDKVYSEMAGLEAVQGNGNAHSRSYAVIPQSVKQAEYACSLLEKGQLNVKGVPRMENALFRITTQAEFGSFLR